MVSTNASSRVFKIPLLLVAKGLAVGDKKLQVARIVNHTRQLVW